MAVLDEKQAVTVTERRVYCDGGGGALGHPGVYLTIEAPGEVACPYCSCRFVLADGADGGGGH
ncbi:MAG: zinc-finger domain-containing protein [Pseudomonadota bacterium]|nr:zinc-finger domain-containing protein [Pseudomonadota bacterium]